MTGCHERHPPWRHTPPHGFGKFVEVQLMSRVHSGFLIAALSFILVGTAAAQVEL
jgi:hypothetical protein